MDFFFPFPPFLLSFSFGSVTFTANSCSSLYLFISFGDGEDCEVAGGVFHADAPALCYASVLGTSLFPIFYSLPDPCVCKPT